MMWCFKKDMFCREHIFFGWFIIFKTVCLSSVSVGLAVVRRPVDKFHVALVRAPVRISYAREFLRSYAWSHKQFFGRSRVWTPGLAHDLFVGPGFDSLTLQHDIGQGYTGPKNRRSGPGNRTLDPWKDHAARAGVQTLDPQKSITCKARGSNPGPPKKIVRTIVHAIAKCNRTHDRKISRVHEIRADAQTSSTWNVSAGRRTTARPTENGRRTDRFKNDKSSEKDMFPAEHIFFEAPHHVPIYVHFNRLTQPASIRM